MASVEERQRPNGIEHYPCPLFVQNSPTGSKTKAYPGVPFIPLDVYYHFNGAPSLDKLWPHSNAKTPCLEICKIVGLFDGQSGTPHVL